MYVAEPPVALFDFALVGGAVRNGKTWSAVADEWVVVSAPYRNDQNEPDLNFTVIRLAEPVGQEKLANGERRS